MEGEIFMDLIACIIIAVILFAIVSVILQEKKIKPLREKAEAGDVDTQMQLAEMYKNGNGISKDHKEALKYYLMAAEKGNVDAQVIAGRYFIIPQDSGKKIQQNIDEGLKWWKKAAEQGDYTAQFSLGLYHLNILDGATRANVSEAEKQEGAEFLKKVASECKEEMAVHSQIILGDYYYEPVLKAINEGKEDEASSLAAKEEAGKWYLMAAENGNAEAQCKYAYRCLYYHYGNRRSNLRKAFSYTSIDYKDEAKKWLLKSAEQGYKFANLALGCLILDVNPDVLDKNFEKGLENAKELYEEELEEAFPYLQKAAADGYSVAHLLLGEMYNARESLFKSYWDNLREAAKWYRQAEKSTNIYLKQFAKKRLEFIYIDPFNRESMQKMVDELIMLSTLSLAILDLMKGLFIDRGDYTERSAQVAYKIAMDYFHGTDNILPHNNIKDEELAIKWVTVSADAGSDEAKYFLALTYYERKDYRTAFWWAYKGARNGNSDCQFVLGNLYINGNGVEKSEDKAIAWLRQAARDGHRKAQALLIDNGIPY